MGADFFLVGVIEKTEVVFQILVAVFPTVFGVL
jgi:hypothetical protein